MVIEVLLSTMYQDDWKIVDKCNLKTSAIIINQCNKKQEKEKKTSYGTVKMISTTERGLSKSRNEALLNSNADVCVLCDDDIVFHDEYSEIIENAFNEVPMQMY